MNWKTVVGPRVTGKDGRIILNGQIPAAAMGSAWQGLFDWFSKNPAVRHRYLDTVNSLFDDFPFELLPEEANEQTAPSASAALRDIFSSEANNAQSLPRGCGCVALISG